MVDYNVTGLGEVLDRFRWEGGCIAEHVSKYNEERRPGVANLFIGGMLARCIPLALYKSQLQTRSGIVSTPNFCNNL